jgi:ABC-2 type transport system permease protein
VTVSWPRPRHVVRIARVELRRSLRKTRDNRTLLAVTVLNLVVFGLLTAGAAFGAWLGGRALARGEELPVAVVPVARGAAGLVVVSVAAFSLMRAAGRGGTLDCLDGLLSTARVGDVAAGVLLAEVGRLLVLAAPPLLVVGATFAVAAGAPSLAATLPLALLAVGVVAVPVGFAGGLALRYVITRFDPIAAHRTAVGAVLLTGWMVFALSGALNDVGAALFDPLRASPLGWLADLLLLGVPRLGADPLRAVAGLAVAVVVAVPGTLGSVRAAEAVWLSDPPDEEEEAGDAAGTAVFDGGALGGLVGRQTRAVATAVWLRARRAPIELTYVLYPVFFGAYVFQDIFQRGSVPAYVPSTLLTYTAWGVGAAVTLNPLGAQGPTLPGTLTSRIDGRAYLRGHLLVGAVVGAPLATALTVGTAVASPLGVAEVALLAVATPVAAVAAAGLACGFGVLFPRFGSVKVTGNREAVVPSKTAGIGYSLALLVLLSVAGVGLVPAAREAVVDAVGAPPAAVVAVAVAPLLACSYLSYRFAAGRIADYRLD